MPVGSSIMLNPEAYYAGNMPTVTQYALLPMNNIKLYHIA